MEKNFLYLLLDNGGEVIINKNNIAYITNEYVDCNIVMNTGEIISPDASLRSIVNHLSDDLELF